MNDPPIMEPEGNDRFEPFRPATFDYMYISTTSATNLMYRGIYICVYIVLIKQMGWDIGTHPWIIYSGVGIRWGAKITDVHDL